MISPRIRGVFGLSSLGALLFFGALWRLDFPKPMIDDLFYIGAGLNLAGGGDLSNPLLARQGFPSHFFFAYPPMHSYALGGWLKMFGVSAWSVTAFSAVLYFITAVSTMAILRRFRAPWWMEWLVPAGVTAALFVNGLRPEPVSVALTMAGLAVAECAPPGLTAWFVSVFVMMIGALTAPRIAPFSAVLMAGAGMSLLTANAGETPGGSQGVSKKLLWRMMIVAGVATAAAGLIFATEIHFRFGEFWRTFLYHSQRAGGPRFRSLVGFFFSSAFMPALFWPVWLLLGHLIYFGWSRPGNAALRLGFVTLWGFPLAWLAGGLGAGALWYAALAVFLLAAGAAQYAPGRTAILSAALCGSLLFANAGTLAQMYGVARGKIRNDLGTERDGALALRSSPEHALLVDHETARYLYNYRLPPGVLDVAWAGDFAEKYFVKGVRNGDVAVAGPDTINTLRAFGQCLKQPGGWAPFGMFTFIFETHPRRVFIVDENTNRGDWSD